MEIHLVVGGVIAGVVVKRIVGFDLLAAWAYRGLIGLAAFGVVVGVIFFLGYTESAIRLAGSAQCCPRDTCW